jgi:hypothetical protein
MWHERGVREYSADVERRFRSPCWCDQSHLASYSQLGGEGGMRLAPMLRPFGETTVY